MAPLIAGLVRGPRPIPGFKPGDMAGAKLAHASGSVARFRAIAFHGQLDTGELVSVFDANNHAGPGAIFALCRPGGSVRCTRSA